MSKNSLKLLLIIFILSCSCSQPFSSQKPDNTITKSLITESLNGKSELSVIVNSYEQNIPIIYANGGFQTTSNSFMADKEISVSISQQQSAKQSLTLLLAGKANIAIMTLFEYLDARELKNDDSTVIFMLTGYSTGCHAVVANSPFLQPADLKGQKVALVKNSAEHILLDFFLKNNNVTPDNIQTIYTNTSQEALDLFKSKEAQAAALSSYIDTPESILISTRDASELIPYVAVTTDSFLLSYPELISDFTAAIFTAGAKFSGLSNDFSSLAKSGLIPEQFARNEILKITRPASHSDNMKFFSIDDTASTDINTLLNLSQLLPAQFYEQTTKSVFSLYTPLVIENIDLPNRIKNVSLTGLYAPRSPAYPLFPIPIPFEDNNWEITSFHERKLAKITEIAALFPSSVIRLSYVPNRNANSRYAAEQRISVCSKRLYQIMRKRTNLRIETNYASISAVNSSSYSGPYEELSTVLVEIMAVSNE